MKKQKTDEMTWQLGLTQVLDGKREEFEDRRMTVAPVEVLKFAKKLGWRHREPADGRMLETNGWDWDWWLNIERGDKHYTIAGSGFYGGFNVYESDPE